MTLEPFQYSALEVDVMRGGFAVAALYSLDGLKMFAPMGDQGRPVGVARWIDLRWVSSHRRVLDRLAQVAVIAYAVDLQAPWALAYLTLFLLVHVTLRSSEGSVNHGHHLVTVVAVTQLAAIAVWNAHVQWDWDLGSWLASDQADTVVWWTVQAILAVYFTSGLSKLLYTGGRWIQQSPGLLVSATSRLETGGAMLTGGGLRRVARVERLIGWLLRRPATTRLLFAAGLLVELVSPVGLINENVLLVVGVALIVLHFANARLLLLPFPAYQVLVFVYLVNLPRLWA